MNNVAVVTGGSSGIGRETARLLAEAGYTVYELSRSGHDTESVRHITADISDSTQVNAAIEQIAAANGRIDLLVNNAGFGISGAVEFSPLADAEKQFDVNFFGMVRTTQAALPYLRASHGRIINVSSVAAPVAIPFQSFYSAAKAATNNLTLALANELRPLGVSVCAIMPGDVHTGFTAARRKAVGGADIYGATQNKAVAAMEHDEQTGKGPDFIAHRIVRLAQKNHVKVLTAAGCKYKLFCFIWKVLPIRLSNWLVGRIYS